MTRLREIATISVGIVCSPGGVTSFSSISRLSAPQTVHVASMWGWLVNDVMERNRDTVRVWRYWGKPRRIRESWPLGQDLSQTPSECKSRALPLYLAARRAETRTGTSIILPLLHVPRCSKVLWWNAEAFWQICHSDTWIRILGLDGQT